MSRYGHYRPKKPRFRPRRRVDVMLAFMALVVLFALFDRFSPPADHVELLPEESAGSVLVEAPAPAGSEPDAPGPVAKAGAPVVFLMQNVQNYFVSGEQQRSLYKLYPKREEEREAVADTIASAKPEIVGLVEIGGPKALDDLADRMAKRGLEYPHRKVLTREGEDRALGVLSKYPIVRDDSKAEYGLFGTHRRKMLRGILDVTIQVKDGRKFRILGAHLKSHKGNSEAAAEALRTQEARTLALYIRQIVKESPNMPLLVYGDWNDGPADPSLRILTQGVSKESALKRLHPADPEGNEWTHFYKAGGEYLIYDQIYVNSVLHSRMGRKSRIGVEKFPRGVHGSDHRAVWCELR